MIRLNSVGGAAGNTRRHVIEFRTIMEKNLSEIVPNKHAIKSIVSAAKKTSEEDPFLHLNETLLHRIFFGSDKNKHHWVIYNHILNEISQMATQGHMARAIGLPVLSK